MTRTKLTVGDKERLSARAYESIKNANGRSVTLPQLYNELQPLSIELTTLRTVLKKLLATHTDIRSTNDTASRFYEGKKVSLVKH